MARANQRSVTLKDINRDEAHRFAQHYHHIMRRKAQLEEGVKQGRRPPKRKSPSDPRGRGRPEQRE
jgi:excinuclease UvrABC nuclease subunit